jgi:hypothetical protein
MRSLLGSDWIVDNFQYSDGMPSDHKVGSDYTRTHWVDPDNDGEYQESKERRYAHRLLDVRPCRLAGREALAATFEVANVEQLRIRPEVIDERVRLVLVRTDYAYAVPTVRRFEFPSFLLVGYANQPEDFERGIGDFDRLLSAIALGEGEASEPKNLRRGFACSAPTFRAPAQTQPQEGNVQQTPPSSAEPIDPPKPAPDSEGGTQTTDEN